LRDLDYRYAYAEDFLNTLVATQIKVLREQRNLTQQELADLIGTKQAGISRLENVNYSAWKTQTLRKLARAFGVRLRITFETFGTLLDDSARFSPQNLERPEFSDDPAFSEGISASEPVVAETSIAHMLDQPPVQRLANIEQAGNGGGGLLIPFQNPRPSANLGEDIYASLGRLAG
jgi:transcriptional regulator with XRE-family HTH domain